MRGGLWCVTVGGEDGVFEDLVRDRAGEVVSRLVARALERRGLGSQRALHKVLDSKQGTRGRAPHTAGGHMRVVRGAEVCIGTAP